jgi:imidazoleglycerol-phosphate dehydratase/histidinol-phosphatase
MGNDEPSTEMDIALESSSWAEIERLLMLGSRKAVVERATKETQIHIEVDLNGTGKGKIDTGLKFFDHMLEQIPRHGGIDMEVLVKGDLEVDEHHTIEDTGIVLGECFKRALGSKRGVERYGFALPMDEAEAQVLLDFGGRYELVWSVELQREYVGDFPTEMLKHFFSAFGQACGCNLNINAKGDNTHHIIEAVFKAFARAIRQAVRVTGTEIPSSKGVL